MSGRQGQNPESELHHLDSMSLRVDFQLMANMTSFRPQDSNLTMSTVVGSSANRYISLLNGIQRSAVFGPPRAGVVRPRSQIVGVAYA